MNSAITASGVSIGNRQQPRSHCIHENRREAWLLHVDLLKALNLADRSVK